MNTAEQNTKQCMEESDVIKQFRRLFPNDAIGIWVRTGKSVLVWLKKLLKNGGYDTNTETAWSFRDSLKFRLFV